MSNDLDVRLSPIRLQQKVPTYKAYHVTLESIDDIAELLEATEVDVVTRKDDGKTREFRVHFTTPKEKYSLRIADGIIPGDYLVRVDDEFDPIWNICSSREITDLYDRVKTTSQSMS